MTSSLGKKELGTIGVEIKHYIIGRILFIDGIQLGCLELILTLLGGFSNRNRSLGIAKTNVNFHEGKKPGYCVRVKCITH